MQSASTDERDPSQSGKAKPPGRKNLVGTVSEHLRRAILSGNLRPGDKLPSEAGLTQQYDVSRTVVREAIASLRADGLVEARHGVGVFVRSNQMQTGLPFQSLEPSRISSIIEMLELRAGIEIEAAGLAAVRRSPAQEEAIWERYDDLNRLVGKGQPTTAADFAFHLAIADAANNPRFREFLEMLGRHMIPRAMLEDLNGEPTSADYLKQLQDEHKRIADAISARDEDAARRAVRDHLKGGQDRYRKLIRGG